MDYLILQITKRAYCFVIAFFQVAVFSVCCFPCWHVRNKRTTTPIMSEQWILHCFWKLSDHEDLIFLGNLKTNALTLFCVMSKNDQTFWKTYVVNTARFLKYVWPFFDIMHERVSHDLERQSDSSYLSRWWRIVMRNGWQTKVRQAFYSQPGPFAIDILHRKILTCRVQDLNLSRT